MGGWFDSDLSEKGRRQASAIARELRDIIPGEASPEVYSSDLKRTMQTAEAISAELGVNVQAMADLREKSYGEAEGRPQQWLDERFVFP
ncbi:MAG TPA: histidine phosphatase family protein, partial [Tepidiformaceae bacterium]|nr:histidine phosphatase family protein [Tepidiformaceae bacterium]